MKIGTVVLPGEVELLPFDLFPPLPSPPPKRLEVEVKVMESVTPLVRSPRDRAVSRSLRVHQAGGLFRGL